MITTNLTLTNGVTSEIPIRVVGITFEVDSKLAVNPSVVFPLDVAIDSSEIIGIDFDETLYTGDYTESITINTLGGRNDIVHTVNMVDLSDPVPIIDITFDMTTVGNQHFLGNAQGDDFLMYTGVGANLAAGQEIVVPIDGDYQTICYMLDGVVHYDTGSFFAGDYTINKIGIVQNFFFYDGILTTEEKAYLEYYPDRFIYKNGDVLDSGILTIEKIALIRAYFPMCEEGDYIVDASKPSGVVTDLVLNGNFDDDTVWVTNDASVTIADGVTHFLNAGLYKSVSQPITYEIGKTYDITYTISNYVAGHFSSSIGSGLDGIKYYTAGTYTDIFTVTDAVANTIKILGFDETANTFDLDNISVTTQVENRYYVTNYTAAVRDDAKMLTHGLTAFTERDDEGVVL